ncbi:hypothetical protein OSB04_010419 [Centaurea solstitialis]|uniref:PGG domain-containing protein n=1 Tax=Centaurea solstitialis TaxID=347529 RepID=A0AA38TEN4_9ASTR|nr:hypothetical protein OSB04_010202 [Centaurea solstitialis]KAJ9555805.1 hypothetical protein OSB04_010419 [Centaurea solstitialis]
MSSNSHLIVGLSIQQAALTNDWDSVEPIFEQDPKSMTKRITCKGETPLMIAVGTNRSHDFVKRLVDRVVEVGDVDKLFDTCDVGDNPLHRAARIGNTTDARVLVGVNQGMTLVPNKDGYRPLNLAAAHGNKRTLRYLLSVTTDVVTEEDGSSPYAGVAGGDLITVMIQAGFLDIAIEIIARHPNIALEEDKHKRTALEVLGTKPEYFSSGSTLGLWGHLIYISPPIKKIHDIKVKNYQSKLLTEHICRKVIEKADHDTTWKILGSSTYAAVQHGTLEVVKECISTYPDIIWYTGTDEEFHLSLEAITQRQEQVYNLLSESSAHRVYQTTLIDNKEEKENSLHKAAKLAPPHRLNVVTGAALQMQRELQWYKEVENFIDPLLKNALNNKKKSPKTIFIEEHEGLLKDAQDWMKEASASCTVVAALIVTMAFAGAFTIPGGNKDDGKPLFIDKATFMLFIISDAIALFSSTTSVLMFLGILTTRFAHDDFLYALPKRMTIGLVSLFTALVTTMIAFSATLVLVLEDKVPWIVAPLVIIACIPIGLLAWMQFPLLIELVWSTYGPSIFRKPKADT